MSLLTTAFGRVGWHRMGWQSERHISLARTGGFWDEVSGRPELCLFLYFTLNNNQKSDPPLVNRKFLKLRLKNLFKIIWLNFQKGTFKFCWFRFIYVVNHTPAKEVAQWSLGHLPLTCQLKRAPWTPHELISFGTRLSKVPIINGPIKLLFRSSPSEVYNLVAREARVFFTSIVRPAWFSICCLVGVRLDVIQSSDVKAHHGFPSNGLPSMTIAGSTDMFYSWRADGWRLTADGFFHLWIITMFSI